MEWYIKHPTTDRVFIPSVRLPIDLRLVHAVREMILHPDRESK